MKSIMLFITLFFVNTSMVFASDYLELLEYFDSEEQQLIEGFLETLESSEEKDAFVSYSVFLLSNESLRSKFGSNKRRIINEVELALNPEIMLPLPEGVDVNIWVAWYSHTSDRFALFNVGEDQNKFISITNEIWLNDCKESLEFNSFEGVEVTLVQNIEGLEGEHSCYSEVQSLIKKTHYDVTKYQLELQHREFVQFQRHNRLLENK